MKKISLIAGSAAVAGIVALAPLVTMADTNVTAAITASTNVSSTSVNASFNITKAKARADQEIERRINNLNQLSTRIGQMKRLSSSEISSLQASISSEITVMNNLKATIDAETVAANLKTDIQSITKDYRVYLLILPQGRIAAASDRVMTIVSDMQTLSTQLQTRITAAGNPSAAVSAYADMQTQITNANAAAQAAVSETQGLTPDQGNATVEASNKAALTDANAKLKTATADLKAARADIATILKAVKGTGVSASASTTTP
jgi:hypothetical protein